jgi:hypothetical protein
MCEARGDLDLECPHDIFGLVDAEIVGEIDVHAFLEGFIK